MAIKTFINGQENGVITFSGNTEPCAVYANGERQDNISYVPQSVEGVNSVEYKSEYKRNIRTMRIEGNTEQYQGVFAPQNIVIPTAFEQPSSAPIIVSATPITVPNGARLTLTANKTGNGNISSLSSGFIVIISDSRDDIANNYTEILEDYGTPQYLATPKVSGQFYIGIANFLPGGIDNPQAYWDFLRANYTFTLSTEGNTVPTPDFPQPIRNANEGRLPRQYQEVEYIESTGTQYIDTGFYPNQDTRVVCDFQLTEVYVSFVFGAREASGVSNPRTFTFNMGSGNPPKFVTTYGAGGQKIFKDADLVRHTVDKNKSKTTFDGTTLEEVYSEFTSPKTLALFACNQASTNGYLPSKMKLYSCQMYDNGTLIRDYYPCYRKSDNVVGLYDLVNGVFYTNAGTGEFVKGTDVNASNIALELRGVNLCDLNRLVTGSYLANGNYRSIKLYVGAGNRVTAFINAKLPSRLGFYLAISYEDGASGVNLSTTKWLYHSTVAIWQNRVQSFISTEDYIYVSYASQADMLANVTFLQVEIGEETPYEPYFEPVTVEIPPSVTVGNSTIPLRFAKYKNADYLLIDRTNGTVKYYQYSTEGDATKPLSEQVENNPPLEYTLYDKANKITTDLGQSLFELPTENQTNIITITSTPSVSKLSVNYAKYGGVI